MLYLTHRHAPKLLEWAKLTVRLWCIFAFEVAQLIFTWRATFQESFWAQSLKLWHVSRIERHVALVLDHLLVLPSLQAFDGMSSQSERLVSCIALHANVINNCSLATVLVAIHLLRLKFVQLNVVFEAHLGVLIDRCSVDSCCIVTLILTYISCSFTAWEDCVACLVHFIYLIVWFLRQSRASRAH